MGKPRVLVLAAGGKTPDDGGSGVRELFEYSQLGHQGLDYQIVGVVSNHARGGVWQKMNDLQAGDLFHHLDGPFDNDWYLGLVERFQPDVIMLSGWLKRVVGEILRRITILNIHPALLPLTRGLYGHHAHEKVAEEFEAGRISYTECVMHFVTSEEYDDERLACMRHRVFLRPGEDADKIGKRVNEKERAWQAYVLSLVANGSIWLDEEDRVHFSAGETRTMLMPNNHILPAV